MSGGWSADERQMVCRSSADQISVQLQCVVSVRGSACAKIQTKIRCIGQTDRKTNILFFGSCIGATDTQPICNISVEVSAEPFYIPRYVVLG
jgi:hypothetical protein